MIKKLLLGLTFAIFSITASAEQKPDEQKIREMIQKMAPNVEVQSVRSTPIPGLFEVVVDETIMYTSYDGRYLIYGDLIDLDRNGYNLSEEARGRVRLERVGELDPDTFITYEADDEQHMIYVFTDIDCQYCKQFHNQIKEINAEGVTVQYIAFPREPKGTESYNKAVKVWCAKDPKSAISLAYNDKMDEIEVGTPASQCTIVEEHLKAVAALRLTGTPAILFPNGALLPGYVPVEILMEEIQNNSAGTVY